MKILVCMDSSIFADEIVNIISKRAWICGTRFHLITVVNTSGIADYDNQLLHQAEQILQARVQVLQDRMKNHRAQISSDVLEGRPAPTIIQAAKDCRADLILIGSHGDTGVRKAGIGSVAGAVVNEAPCSVEVVKMVKRHRDRAGAKAS